MQTRFIHEYKMTLNLILEIMQLHLCKNVDEIKVCGEEKEWEREMKKLHLSDGEKKVFMQEWKENIWLKVSLHISAVLRKRGIVSGLKYFMVLCGSFRLKLVQLDAGFFLGCWCCRNW